MLSIQFGQMFQVGNLENFIADGFLMQSQPLDFSVCKADEFDAAAGDERENGIVVVGIIKSWRRLRRRQNFSTSNRAETWPGRTSRNGNTVFHATRIRLHNSLNYAYGIGGMRIQTYSTVQVARLIKVHKMTLLHWLWDGKLGEPKHRTDGGQDLRIWTEKDLARARGFRQANYGKGKGPKKRA